MGGRPHTPVGKLAVGKDGEGKGREKRRGTYQKSRKTEKSTEVGQSGIPWTVPHSGGKKNEKEGRGRGLRSKWLIEGEKAGAQPIFFEKC